MTHIYETWKEIISQPATWEATLDVFDDQRADLRRFLSGASYERVLTIGCGSTHYLAQSAAALISRHARIPAEAFPETLRAVDRFREVKGGKVLAVSCYPDSDLVQRADFALVSPAAQEESIAQTRSFSSMFVLIQALTGVMAEDEAMISSLRLLPEALSTLVTRFDDTPERLGANLDLERFYFLGGGVLYGLACEAMLKMKEMTLSYAEGYHPLEFRHGPMSMVNNQTLVIGLVPETGADEVVHVLVDMQDLGAHILALAEDGRICDPLQEADSSQRGVDVIELKSGLDAIVRAPLVLPPLQHMAYHRAVAKGFDPDHPHNLSAVISLS